MQCKRWLVGSLVVAFATGGMSAVQAQPDPNNTVKGANPANQAPGGFDWRTATPEQRQQQIQKFMELRLREGLISAGFADKAMQDRIVEFARALDKERQPLREKSDKVREALRNNASEEQTGTLIKELRTAVADVKKRRDVALKGLDAQIGYSKKPRLEAFLMMADMLGDEASFAGGLGGLNMLIGGVGGRGLGR